MSGDQPVLSYYGPPRFDDPVGEGEVVIRASRPSALASIVWLSLALGGVVAVSVLLLVVGVMMVGDAGIVSGGVPFLLLVLIGGGLATVLLLRQIQRHRSFGDLPVTFRVDREGRLTIFDPRRWGAGGPTWQADEMVQIRSSPIRRGLGGGRWFELRLLLVTSDEVGVSLAAESPDQPAQLAQALWRALKRNGAEDGARPAERL